MAESTYRHPWWLLSVVAVLVVTAACGPNHPRPFYDGSAWNRTLSVDTFSRPDPNSGNWVGELDNTTAVADVSEYGVPVYDGSNAPTKRVHCSESWCQDNGRTAKVPNGATPSSGSDGALASWDQNGQTTYDFWIVTGNTTTDIYSHDASHSCTANDNPACDGNGVTTTGSGISRLAGVVRPDDLTDGINHAVVLSTRNVRGTCSFRAPATKSDGCNFGPAVAHPIPEGVVLQLDPGFDVDGYTSDNTLRQVLHAMQTFGAVVIDQGGADAAFIFDRATGIPDYRDLDIPWWRVRALADCAC